MQAINRWRNWTPADEKVGESLRPALPKPTKPASVSFGGSIPKSTQNFFDPVGIPADEPDAWREPFHSWATAHCVFHERCFGGIGRLHAHFCEWADDHPTITGCTRPTFERLLTDAGFLIADGLVSGLMLAEREDWQAPRWKREPPKPAPQKAGRK